MAPKFPLIMSGKSVRTIADLRKYFDLETVLGYYSDGQLLRWLEDRYYNEEAEKIRALEVPSEKFNQKLCEILGAAYSKEEDKGLDISTAVKNIKNKERHKGRRELLEKYTADEKILSSDDIVAFSQEELDALVQKIYSLKPDDDGKRVIYLCGEHFNIPANIEDIIYRGVNNPTVEFDGEIVASGIDLQELRLDISDYIKGSNSNMIDKVFEKNLSLGFKLIQQEANRNNVDAQYYLGFFYHNGLGIEKDDDEAVKWLKKAAHQGDKRAEKSLESCYRIVYKHLLGYVSLDDPIISSIYEEPKPRRPWWRRGPVI